VLAPDDNFTIKVIDLLLFLLCHFLEHIIPRDEDCRKVAGVREILLVLYFAVEVFFAMVLRSILHTLKMSFVLSLLLDVRILEIVQDRLGWLIRVLIPGSFLTMDIEARGSLPARLTLLLLLHSQAVFIDKRERLGKVIFRVGVEIRRVVFDHHSQFFFLHLPDVVLLTAIRKHFDTIRHLNTWFKSPTCARVTDDPPVCDDEITLRYHGARAHTLQE